MYVFFHVVNLNAIINIIAIIIMNLNAILLTILLN